MQEILIWSIKKHAFNEYLVIKGNTVFSEEMKIYNFTYWMTSFFQKDPHRENTTKHQL